MITLTRGEKALFTLLKGAAREKGAALRVAGGWVRDKVLGRGSNDIDIAVENMSGEEFAGVIKAYAALQQTEVRVELNPEQSKELHSAKIQLLGAEIDLNRTRKERYTKTSRIPIVEPGTLRQDCLRRDFTINAMYYNLETEQVEDVCGTSLDDLSNKLIRCLIPVHQSFQEDPLRMLRAIRYAARFDFELDASLLESIVTHGNKIPDKVSRERVGEEVMKMLHHTLFDTMRPIQYAIELLHCTRLFPIVFALGRRSDPQLAWTAEHQASVIRNIKQLDDPFDLIAILAAIVLPFRHYTYSCKKSVYPIAHFILRDALRFSKSIADPVCSTLQAYNTLVSLLHEPPSPVLCASVGQCLLSSKGTWKTALDLIQRFCPHEKEAVSDLHLWIKDHELDTVASWRPLLTGKDVMDRFSVRGKHIGILLAQAQEWRFQNPHQRDDKEACLAALALDIPTVKP